MVFCRSGDNSFTVGFGAGARPASYASWSKPHQRRLPTAACDVVADFLAWSPPGGDRWESVDGMLRAMALCVARQAPYAGFLFRSAPRAYEVASFTTTPVFTTGGGDV
jgi:hypothetical protein